MLRQNPVTRLWEEVPNPEEVTTETKVEEEKPDNDIKRGKPKGKT